MTDLQLYIYFFFSSKGIIYKLTVYVDIYKTGTNLEGVDWLIAKILHCEYFVLLSNFFHTLIQYNNIGIYKIKFYASLF